MSAVIGRLSFVVIIQSPFFKGRSEHIAFFKLILGLQRFHSSIVTA
ncbi:hypothetical protein CRENPOLYSF1_330023 [Crenothrix polyspora]|uniref:Uncharacterized protein n=1 Tax=Crenothrix polyspora TaxID=360316 RepID=A0A1R4HA37_9GAMM|nr:hypothetical protein CRENPOLYSF1_330023 [Crenothrix polyspora]